MTERPKQRPLDHTTLATTLFDCLPDTPCYIKDTDLRYVWANAAMARVCAVPSRDHLLGKQSADFFPAAHSQHYDELDQQVIRSGQPISHRLQLVTARSSENWICYSLVPVRSMCGTITGVAGVARTLGAADRSSKVHRRVEAATRVLHTHLQGDIKVSDLASAVGASVAQLERDFNQHFHMGPTQYLAMLRMEQACRLLGEQSMPIAAIAQACGYSDQSAFSRRFKRSLGVTPGAYRQARSNP